MNMRWLNVDEIKMIAIFRDPKRFGQVDNCIELKMKTRKTFKKLMKGDEGLSKEIHVRPHLFY